MSLFDFFFVIVVALLIEMGIVALIAWGVSAIIGFGFWPVFAVLYLLLTLVKLARN